MSTLPGFRLRNARQSEPYDEALLIQPEDRSLVLIEARVPARSGLRYDPDSQRITGTPAHSGSVEIELRYRFTDERSDASHAAKVALYVNPDPKTLWKTLPSDRSAPHWKPDLALQSVNGAERRIVAARRRGRSHAHVGSFCDDDFFVAHDQHSGWYLALVADGAGSAEFSRLGSRLAVEAAGRSLQASLAGAVGASLVAAVKDSAIAADQHQAVIATALQHCLGEAVRAALQAHIDCVAAEPDLIGSEKALSTTLLIGLTRQCGDRWLCAGYAVGDGAIAVHCSDQAPHLLSVPDTGEYAGQTRFLDGDAVSAQALQRRIRHVVCDDYTALVLMSDGVSDAWFASDAALSEASAWAHFWAAVAPHLDGPADGDPEQHALLEWLNFWSQGNHDDRTLAIITRPAAPG